MVYQTLFRVVLIEIGLVLFTVDGTYIEYETSATWDGVGFYISVKRETVQEKLDEYHSSVSNRCGEGLRLFIPDKSVFPDLETIDHHPVHVNFGYVTSHDFDDYLQDNPDPCIAVSGLEVAVTIPLLAANSTGSPDYALLLAKLFERSRGDIPKTNFLCPYIPVDEIQLNDLGAVVRNGSDELRVSFVRHDHPCKPPPSIVIKEFDEFLVGEFYVGLPEPDFSFCDRHSFRSKFCTNAKRVKCAVHRHAPNICQVYKDSNAQPCEASVQIVNITSGFRDFILLRNDPVSILASESYSANTLLGLKYPCQE